MQSDPEVPAARSTRRPWQPIVAEQLATTEIDSLLRGAPMIHVPGFLDAAWCAARARALRRWRRPAREDARGVARRALVRGARGGGHGAAVSAGRRVGHRDGRRAAPRRHLRARAPERALALPPSVQLERLRA